MTPWRCDCCGWPEVSAPLVHTGNVRSYLRRVRRCPWTFHTLRAMGVCIWCYSRIGLEASR